MKKNITLFVSALAASAILTSCGNSNTTEKGTKVGFAKGAKISSSGLKTLNDGLTLKESYFIVDGVKTESNEVQIGKKVAIVFDGIEGFKEKNGKVYPALSILVLDAKNQVVVTYDNLLKSEAGYDTKDATMLTGSLTIGEPLKQGESYTLTVTVGDKESDGGIVGNITLKVK